MVNSEWYGLKLGGEEVEQVVAGTRRLASWWVENCCWTVLATEVAGIRLVVRMGKGIAVVVVVVEAGAVVINGGGEGRDKG